MSDIVLTQAEANRLIQIEKVRANDVVSPDPRTVGRLTLPLVSVDTRESFWLDFNHSRIDFAKGTYQTRAHQVIPIVRLDFGCSRHTNPDGETFAGPHLHVYREGFGMKWAIALPPEFTSPTDLDVLLVDFCKYCNITKAPLLSRDLYQ